MHNLALSVLWIFCSLFAIIAALLAYNWSNVRFVAFSQAHEGSAKSKVMLLHKALPWLSPTIRQAAFVIDDLPSKITLAHAKNKPSSHVLVPVHTPETTHALAQCINQDNVAIHAIDKTIVFYSGHLVRAERLTWVIDTKKKISLSKKTWSRKQFQHGAVTLRSSLTDYEKILKELKRASSQVPTLKFRLQVLQKVYAEAYAHTERLIAVQRGNEVKKLKEQIKAVQKK